MTLIVIYFCIAATYGLTLTIIVRECCLLYLMILLGTRMLAFSFYDKITRCHGYWKMFFKLWFSYWIEYVLDFDYCNHLVCVYFFSRFEQYVEYALDVPMYFVYRKKTYIDCTGMSFRVSFHTCSFIFDFHIFSRQLLKFRCRIKCFLAYGFELSVWEPMITCTSAGFYARKTSFTSWGASNSEWLGESSNNHIPWGIYAISDFIVVECVNSPERILNSSYLHFCTGQIKKVPGNEGCWWWSLEEAMRFASILGISILHVFLR